MKVYLVLKGYYERIDKVFGSQEQAMAYIDELSIEYWDHLYLTQQIPITDRQNRIAKFKASYLIKEHETE